MLREIGNIRLGRQKRKGLVLHLALNLHTHNHPQPALWGVVVWTGVACPAGAGDGKGRCVVPIPIPLDFFPPTSGNGVRVDTHYGLVLQHGPHPSRESGLRDLETGEILHMAATYLAGRLEGYRSAS